MPKLDLVYVGRFTIKDLDANSRYKFDNKEQAELFLPKESVDEWAI